MSNRLNLVLATAALLAVTGFTGPSMPVVAQPDNCQGCGDKLDGNGDVVHAFGGAGGGLFTGAPNAIHTNWQAGWCASWHNFCGAAQEARSAVVEALADDDQTVIEDVLARYPGILTYDRGSAEVVVRCPYSAGWTAIAVAPIGEWKSSGAGAS